MSVSIIVSAQMKDLTHKQAEKWLERLRTERPQSYKDMTKLLNKYDKSKDIFDCYIKISNVLLMHSTLTEELNTFMEDGNKFVVNKSDEVRFKELMKFFSENRRDAFAKITEFIESINRKNLDEEAKNRGLMNLIKELSAGDPILLRVTAQAFDKAQDLIQAKNLDHLKNYKARVTHDEDDELQDVSQGLPDKQVKDTDCRVKKPLKQERAREPVKQKVFPFSVAMTLTDEKLVLKQFEKVLEPRLYDQLIKILRVFYLNIITRNEALEMLSVLDCEEELDYLKDIIETRESDRRKVSAFRPLSDQDMSALQRASPSYVLMPRSYPSICSNRIGDLQQILNANWVSVPHGTQESFNVRNKNINEGNLLESEDKRYELHLYMGRLEKTLELLKKILDESSEKTELETNRLLDLVIRLGVMQLIYRNGTKEHKEELQWHLKTNTIETCQLFKQRVESQIHELKSIRDVHANKLWLEVAAKNFYKALDLKGFEFKTNQKEKMKATAFLSELAERAKHLETGSDSKAQIASGEPKKDFFSVLNSFESSSRNEKCRTKNLPAIETYNLKNSTNRHLYPLMILAFEDARIRQRTHRMVMHYIDFGSLNESEKTKARYFLNRFLTKHFKWDNIQRTVCGERFNEEELLGMIVNLETQPEPDTTGWLLSADQAPELPEEQFKTLPQLHTISDIPSQYGFLPTKKSTSSLLYGSQHFYTFLRFLYAIYERLLRAEEVAENAKKSQLFQMLFYCCIKSKENFKFEEHLSFLFGKHAYLFSTIYKLFENVVKSIFLLIGCTLNEHSMRMAQIPSEDIYLLLVNKYCLTNNMANMKLLRFNYMTDNHVLYINCFQSFYKAEDSSKDIIKKRAEIADDIEIYTVYPLEMLNSSVSERETAPIANANDRKRRRGQDGQASTLQPISQSSNDRRGRRGQELTDSGKRARQVLESNSLEQLFQGNSIKMLNFGIKEDILVFGGKNVISSKAMRRDIKRAHKMLERLS